ncbi:hypothetical protein LSTR_LSTR003366 [Laodelphax striatellus]|uniref:Methyltransferase domain-containing protein n=1 Tax=Laodelphax striatellus TaxID=195883 RepID=A0A482X5G6_LAOST|nr:hypothetical protein LSTR_LSTR003366 [Laodelphax striatellus]
MENLLNHSATTNSLEGNLNVTEKSKSLSTLGTTLACLTGGAAVLLTVISAPFVSPALRRICLPYVPATNAQVQNVLKALVGRKGRLVDLGSGDGRIVLAAAKAGFRSDGVELNPWLIIFSRLLAFKNGLGQSTAFYREDLFKFQLKPYENIVIFGVKEMMQELEIKLDKEASDGTHVIACRFPLPNRTCSKVIGSGIDTVWVYKYR